MSDLNPANESLKRRYRRVLQEARGLAPTTIDAALRAVTDYDRFNRHKDFGKFNAEDAIAFKKSLTGSLATQRGKLTPVQRFFRWLAEQDGFRTRIRGGDVEFLNLSRHEMHLASEPRVRPAPTLEQLQHVVRLMPAATLVERRDRAIVACFMLAAPRISALASLKLKHLRADGRGIDQDARQVHTKHSKTFTTFFVDVGDDVRSMLLDYSDELKTELGWSGEDPLFPRTKQGVGGARHFHAVGLVRRHWATPCSPRKIVKRAFKLAGVPYHPPHTIRRTLTLEGLKRCRGPEQLKAWSQNFGHDSVLTTLKSYGAIDLERQAEIIASLEAETAPDDEKLDALRDLLSDPRFKALLGK